MLHVGCAFTWNLADHPSYIFFINSVGVRALHRTELRERFADLENVLVKISLYNQFTSLQLSLSKYP